MKKWPAACTLTAVLMTTACGSGGGNSSSSSGELLVAGGFGLKPAVEEQAGAFEEETGAKVTFNFAVSRALLQQIEGGLPADVFIAPEPRDMEEARTKGLVIADTEQVYAVGRLALATSPRMGFALEELEQLTRPEVKQVIIANPESAAYGRAAEEALSSAGLWEQIRPKLVYGENMAQVMQYLQSGNVEAGLVALSMVIDATAGLTYVVINESLHQPIRHTVAVLKDTGNEELARRFVAFIRGPQGRAVLEKYGLAVPEEE
jgi:molybdate transport system substrate-binding protein